MQGNIRRYAFVSAWISCPTNLGYIGKGVLCLQQGRNGWDCFSCVFNPSSLVSPVFHLSDRRFDMTAILLTELKQTHIDDTLTGLHVFNCPPLT